MQNTDAISARNIPFPVSSPPANGLYQYDSTTNTFLWVTPLAGTKVYYVSDSSGGAVNRKLTFTNGILTAET